MLLVKDLVFSYPRKRKPVLDHITLSIKPGGIYGLLGRNGVGKSTLLYLIAGLLTPKSGIVKLNGKNTRKRKAATLSEIFIVPEIFELPKVKLDTYVSMTAPFYPRFSIEDMRRHLQMFDMPYDINLGQLSMGQAKKVFMSFALAANTSLLLMDEPTNGLDIPGKAAFKSFIASSMTDERSIIISTHQVQDINLLLDHVIIMENSGVLLNESVPEILRRLRFDITDNPNLISKALYTLPSIQGTQTVSLNSEDIETEINLEILFDLVIKQPQMINEIFKNEQEYELK